MAGVGSGVGARSEGLAHPLLQSRAQKKVDVIVLTSDRGLAGGFNSNITRRVNRFMFENAKTRSG